MKVFIQRGGDFYASRNYLTKRIRGFDCAIEMNISNKIKKKDYKNLQNMEDIFVQLPNKKIRLRHFRDDC